MKKIAVILFNLGGPDGPSAVAPFLLNLFSDPAILRVPWFIRPPLARLIATRRAPHARAIYAKIGGSSPILANTIAQSAALQERLKSKGQVKCFTFMRYWHPFAEESARQVREFGPDQIVLLPLYPQYSTTTTQSGFAAWDDAAKKEGLVVPTFKVRSYPDEEGFIHALSQSLTPALERAKNHGKPYILFSAHGLPKKIVEAGDPYANECARTAQALRHAAGLDEKDAPLCYQSRVGSLPWTTPFTEDEIKKAGQDRRPIVIVPLTFVSEHSETLYEIDMLHRELAQKAGVPYFERSPALGVSPAFIGALARLVQTQLISS